MAEALTSLEETVQELYRAMEMTAPAGRRLLDQARLCREAYEEGDLGRAFPCLDQAHELIEFDRARGQIRSDEASLRLHRSIDLMGAVMVTDPPATPQAPG